MTLNTVVSNLFVPVLTYKYIKMKKKYKNKNKVGVNDPCPCGAKKSDGTPIKYKKCCLLKQPSFSNEEIEKIKSAFIKKDLEIKMEKDSLEKKGIFINYVKPIDWINPKSKKSSKVWAIGNRVFYDRPEHETFHEFIIDYLKKYVLGYDWWKEQLEAQQKHFLFKCFIKSDEWSKKNATKDNQVDEHTWYAITDGWIKTLSSLAFDICSLEHTLQLPEHIIHRLKNYNEYQGAHYEIAIAAIFSRLGCEINFLDKEKISTPHCEFIATHIETGVSVAVEVKSRQKSGVKHAQGKMDYKKSLKGDVHKLLNSALKQNPKNKPFIIFIDVNAPLTPKMSLENKPWIKDVQKIMHTYPETTIQKPEEYSAIFFTNFSSHYDEEKESSPNEYLAVIPFYSIYPIQNDRFRNMLWEAVQHYGFVPNITKDKKII